MTDIFISHVEEDADLSLEIAGYLQQAGYTTWHYERDGLPGVEYLAQVADAIEAARAVVLIISPNSLESPHVHGEVIRAYECGKRFIPVLRGVTHAEFQRRQPVWRQALGAATSIRVPAWGVTEICHRIVAGLVALGIQPAGGVALPPQMLRRAEAPALPLAEPSRRRRPRWALSVAAAAALLALAAVVIWGVIGLRSRTGRAPAPSATPAVALSRVQVPASDATVILASASSAITPTQPAATMAPADTATPPPGEMPPSRTREADGMVTILVPAGDFLMGSTAADSAATSDEKPQRTVKLDAFWIDRSEVSNEQYRRCVEAGVCRAPPRCDSEVAAYDLASVASYPVVCVRWQDALAYCEWAGARLPTEAEWEKAARGTDGQRYPWGDAEPDCVRANYVGCFGGASEVGSHPSGASPYGALDMAGNVWEWVNDWWASTYPGGSGVHNPSGPVSGNVRVLRGGSWQGPSSHVRAANRNNSDPDSRAGDFGFRCAAPAEE